VPVGAGPQQETLANLLKLARSVFCSTSGRIRKLLKCAFASSDGRTGFVASQSPRTSRSTEPQAPPLCAFWHYKTDHQE
jgi:hypothetical protein